MLPTCIAAGGHNVSSWQGENNGGKTTAYLEVELNSKLLQVHWKITIVLAQKTAWSSELCHYNISPSTELLVARTEQHIIVLHRVKK